MALMRTSNPVLNRAFGGQALAAGGDMTVAGTVNKTGILLVCAFATACWVWAQFLQDPTGATVAPWMILGVIGGLVFALVTTFKPQWAAITAPGYALTEGLALGGISAMFEVRFPGIAIQAVAVTFGTLFALLVAYKAGVIRATERFKLGVIAATGGVFLIYMAQMLLGLFGVHFASGLNGSSTLGIVFSLVVCAIAALNLVLDFDLIETGAKNGAPRYMEWYGAFALMVTLVWLYLEILRLLSKMRER